MEMMLKAGVTFALTAAFYWVMLSPPVAMHDLYNRVLFLPDSNKPVCTEIAHLPVQSVTFHSKNGSMLHGWYIHNPHATKTILMSHGNGGNLNDFVPTLTASVLAGASVLGYEYQGYGGSEGSPSLDGVIEDAEAAYDFLQHKLSVAPENIVLLGQSLGTGVSCELSKRRHTSALILMSPYTNIRDIAREKLAWLNLYPDLAFPKQVLNNREILSQNHPKTLIIHGELDKTVPVHHARAIASSSINPLKMMIIPNAGHNDILNVAPLPVIAAMTDFLN